MTLVEFGLKHPETAHTLRTLGRETRKRASYANSEQLQGIALQLYKGTLGGHETVVNALRELARTFEDQNRFAEAI
jgi:hypothetical protein